MKLSLRSKWVWTGIVGLTGLFALIIYQYHSQLWILSARLWDLFESHHRLKEFISSFGVYSPLAFILLQVIQVVVAPIPGGAIEFLGGYLLGCGVGCSTP